MRDDYNKVWKYKEIDDQKVRNIIDGLNISEFLAKVLVATLDIDDIDEISRFLKPRIKHLNSAFLLNDMELCVDRIINAVNKKEKIVIFGDYDVDGVTSTAILYDFLKRIDGVVDYYIPNRIDEGYGLSKVAVDNVMSLEPGLIVTVDCGITSIDEVSYIKSKGIDIIITDHHECKNELPDAYGIINPMREDSTYPFKHLAGVGVALKVIVALCDKMGLKDYYLKYMDIVALGTVADVVSLKDENRIMVRYGLKKMMKKPNIGIKKIINLIGLDNKIITASSLGFGLAPRINAAGRLGDARKCVVLLTTEDESKALDIAITLENENRLRQQKEQDILEKAIGEIESQNLDDDSIIVLAGYGWHKGIIGIVASRITDKYFKPCVVLTIKDGIANGSARSIKGFNIFNAINSCKDMLIGFGGHEMAAGLTLNEVYIDDFKKKLNEYALSEFSCKEIYDSIDVTMELNYEDITVENAKKLEHLRPFGTDNLVPVFSCSNIRVHDIKTTGNGKHLRLVLGDSKIDAIAFNKGDLIKCIDTNDYIDVAFELNRNIWNGREKVQMIIKDFKLV